MGLISIFLKILQYEQIRKIITYSSSLDCISGMIVQILKQMKYLKHSYKQSAIAAFITKSKIRKKDLSFLLVRNTLRGGGGVFPPLPRYQWNINPCRLIPCAESNKQLCSTSVSNILKELRGGGEGRGTTWSPLPLSTFCKLIQLKFQVSVITLTVPKIPW